MKPIVYGNVARYFGKKREEDGHTHAWTCYLRPFKNEVNKQPTFHIVKQRNYRYEYRSHVRSGFVLDATNPALKLIFIL